MKRNHVIYQCGVCGFGYRDLGTADPCEEFCDGHGFSSPEILGKAVYHPAIQVVSLAA